MKSPVELAVGTARLVGLDASAAAQVAAAVRPMGEQLFDPPTVKGWPTGDAWLASATLLAREAGIRRLPLPVLPTPRPWIPPRRCGACFSTPSTSSCR